LYLISQLPHCWRAQKLSSPSEPALEVADFIMHAVGRQARKNLKQRDGFLLDFQAVFHSVDRKLASFIEVNAVSKHEPSAAPD
jgi:hypothetical protein